jgi:2-iminobutanoate/2-iminopropanoate deaminase
MLPAAPVTFSMMIGCPSDARMPSATTRPIIFVGPPAANGATIVIGRDGYVCPHVIRDTVGRAAAPTAKLSIRRRGCCVPTAGHTGKSLAGDFEAQVRETFAFIERTLAQADAKLSDLVKMTVFLTDARNHPRMTAIRREILGKDFPASASISISHLANPNALIEIQAVAVIA